jgi:hypothetical protein
MRRIMTGLFAITQPIPAKPSMTIAPYGTKKERRLIR